MTGNPDALRVLIADTSAVTRRVMAAVLASLGEGIEVIEAANGPKAAEFMARTPFDLAFIDGGLPGRAGLDALLQSREFCNALLPVLMVEALDTLEPGLAERLDAYECLAKPLEAHELRLIVANLRAMRRATPVLVVDDTPTARRVIARIVGASRFSLKVETAESGEAALGRLKAEPFDVVFLDHMMPGLDGLETACIIQDTVPAVRVVMMSGAANPAIARASHYFGAAHFLPKPFYPREIDKAMHLALRLPLPSLMAEEAAQAA